MRLWLFLIVHFLFASFCDDAFSDCPQDSGPFSLAVGLNQLSAGVMDVGGFSCQDSSTLSSEDRNILEKISTELETISESRSTVPPIKEDEGGAGEISKIMNRYEAKLSSGGKIALIARIEAIKVNHFRSLIRRDRTVFNSYRNFILELDSYRRHRRRWLGGVRIVELDNYKLERAHAIFERNLDASGLNAFEKKEIRKNALVLAQDAYSFGSRRASDTIRQENEIELTASVLSILGALAGSYLSESFLLGWLSDSATVSATLAVEIAAAAAGVAGGASFSGAVESTKLIANAEIGHDDGGHYFCHLAQELSQHGDQVVHQVLVGAAAGGVLGIALGSFGLVASSLGKTAALTSGSILASLGALSSLREGSVAYEEYQKAEKETNELNQMEHLNRAKQLAADAGIDTAAAAIATIVAYKSISEVKDDQGNPISFRRLIQMGWEKMTNKSQESSAQLPDERHNLSLAEVSQFSKIQQEAINKARVVIGPDGYTAKEMKEQTKILKNAGISDDDIMILRRKGSLGGVRFFSQDLTPSDVNILDIDDTLPIDSKLLKSLKNGEAVNYVFDPEFHIHILTSGSKLELPLNSFWIARTPAGGQFPIQEAGQLVFDSRKNDFVFRPVYGLPNRGEDPPEITSHSNFKEEESRVDTIDCLSILSKSHTSKLKFFANKLAGLNVVMVTSLGASELAGAGRLNTPTGRRVVVTDVAGTNVSNAITAAIVSKFVVDNSNNVTGWTIRLATGLALIQAQKQAYRQMLSPADPKAADKVPGQIAKFDMAWFLANILLKHKVDKTIFEDLPGFIFDQCQKASKISILFQPGLIRIYENGSFTFLYYASRKATINQ